MERFIQRRSQRFTQRRGRALSDSRATREPPGQSGHALLANAGAEALPTPRAASSGAAIEVASRRPRAEGKWLVVGDTRLEIRGVTYGTFAPDQDGHRFPKREM